MVHADTENTKEGDPDLIRIAEAHPEWKPWRSRLDDGGPGSFYATRIGRTITFAEIAQGLESTVVAESADDLGELIAAQDRKDGEIADGTA